MTDWSKRTVSDKLDVKGKSIDRLVSWYFKNEIWVNRRYQRKLVWTKKDKQSFIDSIIKRFPTPSIMLCSYDIIGTDMHRYEIIDGLQRIDAIISFITNKFAVSYNGKECYFDLEILSTTNRALADNRLIQGTPVLPENVCDRILDYELPIILTEQDQEKVEEIFIRINSKGRKLSVHDLRQSSSCDSLANLVRRISCHLRGEFSFDDLMALSDMPKISLSSPDLDYGVDSSNTFWMRHGILSYDRIKQSRDEEIVAQIIGELFIPNCSNPDGNILNKMYKAGERYNTLLNDKIDEIGINEIFDNVCHTFDVIEDIFRSVDSNFSSWLFSKPNKTSECFRIFFIAVHKILGEGYVIKDYRNFAEKIQLLADNTMAGIMRSGNIKVASWNNVFTTVYRYIKPLFDKDTKRISSEVEKEIERRLLQSTVESQMTEYKVGITKFGSGQIHENTIHRIAKALSAMANTDSEEEGLVIIGIANDDEAASRWEHTYNTKSLTCNLHHVTGINEEAYRHFADIDGYLKKLNRLLAAEPMDEDLKEYVLSNFKEISFHDRSLIVIPSKRMPHDVEYDGVVYVRHGNEDKKKKTYNK